MPCTRHGRVALRAVSPSLSPIAADDSAFSQSCLFAATSSGAPYSSLLPSALSSAVFASSSLAASAANRTAAMMRAWTVPVCRRCAICHAQAKQIPTDAAVRREQWWMYETKLRAG